MHQIRFGALYSLRAIRDIRPHGGTVGLSTPFSLSSSLVPVLPVLDGGVLGVPAAGSPIGRGPFSAASLRSLGESRKFDRGWALCDSLHGPPVGVFAGRPYADAPLIAVNTVAKRAAVRPGDRVRDARERCHGIAVRPQRVERYVEAHDRMVSALGVVLPISAVHSIDELSAHLSPRDHAVSVVDQVKSSSVSPYRHVLPVPDSSSVTCSRFEVRIVCTGAHRLCRAHLSLLVHAYMGAIISRASAPSAVVSIGVSSLIERGHCGGASGGPSWPVPPGPGAHLGCLRLCVRHRSHVTASGLFVRRYGARSGRRCGTPWMLPYQP